VIHLIFLCHRFTPSLRKKGKGTLYYRYFLSAICIAAHPDKAVADGTSYYHFPLKGIWKTVNYFTIQLKIDKDDNFLQKVSLFTAGHFRSTLKNITHIA
jgi:hypothetical protein